MANLKRTLAIALAGTISLSSFTGLGFAAELTTEKKLEVLKDLNIVKGDSSDKDSLNLTKNMERYRSVVLSLRLAEGDKESELSNYDNAGKPSFKDAGSFSSYVEKLMAFTKNNDLGVDGFEDGTFKPLDQVTDKAYAKLMLEALGYEYGKDFTWADAVKKAEDLGLAKKGSLDNTAANFGEIVELTYNALATPVKGGNMTLGEKINKPVVESKLAVKSVETNGLNQIIINFNKAVEKDSAVKADNYKLKGGSASLTNAKINLVDDTKVVIDLGTPAAQQDKVTVTVDDVKDMDGKMVEKTSKEVRFLDQELPKAASMQAVGNKTVRVEFSEPMKNTDKNDFLIQDGSKKLYIASVEAVNDSRTKFDITLYNELKDGEISVRVSGATDYAGFAVIPQTEKVEVKIDKEAPTVVKVEKATPEKVVLVFNEDIKLSKTALENFYHTNSKNKAESVEVKENKLTINFAKDSSLPQGTAYLFINKEVMVDLWGNKNEDLRVKLDVNEDNKAPEVKEVKAFDQKAFYVIFNEALKADTVTKTSNYKLFDSEGKEVKAIRDVQYAQDKVIFLLNKDLLGDYTLKVENVKDLSNNEFKGEIKVTIKDVRQPEYADFETRLYNVNDDTQIIRIDFKEAMSLEGRYSVINEDNYVVAGKVLSDIKDASISESENGKIVEISVPKASLKLKVGDQLEIARVADAAGNKTRTLSGIKNLDVARTVEFHKAYATEKNTVVVDINDVLTNIDSDDFIFTTDPANPAAKIPVSSVVVGTNKDNDNKTQITFTLSKELSGNAMDNNKTIYVYTENNNSNNVYGHKIERNIKMMVEDKIRPETKKEDVKLAADGRSATVKFTEKVTGNMNLIATDFMITADGEQLVAGKDYTVSINGDTVTINFTKAVEDNATIALKDKVNYLVDGEGNKAKTFSFDLNR